MPKLKKIYISLFDSAASIADRVRVSRLVAESHRERELLCGDLKRVNKPVYNRCSLTSGDKEAVENALQFIECHSNQPVSYPFVGCERYRVECSLCVTRDGLANQCLALKDTGAAVLL